MAPAPRPRASTGRLHAVRAQGLDTGLGELQAKALQIGVDADGGYAVPEELDRNIIELLRDESPMRQECNQITVGTPELQASGKSGRRRLWLDGSELHHDRKPVPRPWRRSTPSWASIYANPQATQTSLDDMCLRCGGAG